MSTKTSIHQFVVPGIDAKPIQFEDFAGKKILLVNTASACGFTPQYGALQELFETTKDRLVVVGVPCNDFGKQEPGTEDEIQQFCTINYGVQFPMTTKMNIQSSPRSPLYTWLCQKEKNGLKDCEVKWNFHKFLLDEEGQLIADFPSDVSPTDEVILSKI